MFLLKNLKNWDLKNQNWLISTWKSKMLTNFDWFWKMAYFTTLKLTSHCSRYCSMISGALIEGVKPMRDREREREREREKKGEMDAENERIRMRKRGCRGMESDWCISDLETVYQRVEHPACDWAAIIQECITSIICPWNIFTFGSAFLWFLFIFYILLLSVFFLFFFIIYWFIFYCIIISYFSLNPSIGDAFCVIVIVDSMIFMTILVIFYHILYFIIIISFFFLHYLLILILLYYHFLFFIKLFIKPIN